MERMGIFPGPGRVAGGMYDLLRSDHVSRAEKLLLQVCSITGGLTFGVPALGALVGYAPDSAREPAMLVYAATAVVFVVSFCILGVKVTGRSAGKRSFGAQFVYAMSRVGLYILLPAAILAVLLIIWALATHQPAFG